MKRLSVFAMLLGIVVTAALAGQFGTAHGSAASTPTHIGGVVPTVGHQVPAAGIPLVYHGGPTMTTNKTYAIYWIPPGYSVSADYISKINQYFADVAHDSNMNSNVYASDTQYSSIQYNSTVGASTTATNAFPASGCPVYAGVTDCLTDAQLTAEIDTVINAQGWTRNGTNMFFLFTPKDVGSCFDSGGGTCTYTAYCAYHGATNSGAIYANQPYTVSSTYPNSCDTHQYPNGSDADPTINVTSHEHNEAITDPHLNAWYDNQGAENGDKCAWTFGVVSGPNGAEYNQTINSHHYFLQREWSNNNPSLTCVQTYQIQGGGGGKPVITSYAPTHGRAGTLVTLNGQNFATATQVLLRSTAATIISKTATVIKTKVPTGVAGLAKWTVTNPAGSAVSPGLFCAC
jgi:hypothetical protein